MSKWIEVEPLMDKAKEYGGYYEDTVYAVPLADIEDAPSIDLVRCAECKHKTYCYGEVHMTNQRQLVDIHKDIDFCSYGEREGE